MLSQANIHFWRNEYIQQWNHEARRSTGLTEAAAANEYG